MPAFNPLDAGPAVGFAMWYLDRGKSPDQVLAILSTHKDYASLGPAVLRQVVARALSNVNATRRALNPTFTGALTDAIGKVLIRTEPVGVRVIGSAIFSDGHEEEVSVTINAPPGMAVSEVLDRAEFFVINGGLERGRGPAYVIVSFVPTLQQIIEGGLPNPSLDLMGFIP